MQEKLSLSHVLNGSIIILYGRIDRISFGNFITSEALLRQTLNHQSKQVVIRRRNVWKIRRLENMIIHFTV